MTAYHVISVVVGFIQKRDPVRWIFPHGTTLYQRIRLAKRVVPRTGPSVILGAPRKSGADRIELNITQDLEKMAIGLNRHGMEPLLEEVSSNVIAPVEMQRIATMRRSDSGRERLGRLRNRHQVNVIGHEAPGPEFNTNLFAVFSEKRQVERSILVGMENRQGSNASLNDVMRTTGNYDSS